MPSEYSSLTLYGLACKLEELQKMEARYVTQLQDCKHIKSILQQLYPGMDVSDRKRDSEQMHTERRLHEVRNRLAQVEETIAQRCSHCGR